MKLMTIARGMAAAGFLAAVGCHSLEVDNPNAPDNQKLLADPNAIEAIGAGSIRGWYNAYQGMEGGGPLSTMAPPRVFPCPPMNFVRECTTISAP